MINFYITIIGYIVFFCFGYIYCKAKYVRMAKLVSRAAKESIEDKMFSIKSDEFHFLSGVSVGTLMPFDQKPQLPNMKELHAKLRASRG